MAQLLLASAIGGLISAGSYFLFNNQNSKQKVEGARLGSSNLTTSTEGAGITRLFGRQRLDGQIIWATHFKETVSTVTETTETGGKTTSTVTTETTNYTYSISLAIAFCEGNGKADVGRIWADGKELDLSSLNYRFYPGTQTQMPDPKIQEVQGTNDAPAYRGVAYIVFDDLQLAQFGNRVPQITAELVVPIETSDPVDLQNSGRAYCLIPGSGETIYSTNSIKKITGGGGNAVTGFHQLTVINENNSSSEVDNVHNSQRIPDVKVAIDNLLRMHNNIDAILLVVSWFGDDLRAGNCTVRPKIEDDGRTLSVPWTVGPYDRNNAQEVSKDDQDKPYFGGTPSDYSVTEIIQYLRGLGKRVVFYPFILMDIPQGAGSTPVTSSFDDFKSEMGATGTYTSGRQADKMRHVQSGFVLDPANYGSSYVAVYDQDPTAGGDSELQNNQSIEVYLIRSSGSIPTGETAYLNSVVSGDSLVVEKNGRYFLFTITQVEFTWRAGTQLLHRFNAEYVNEVDGPVSTSVLTVGGGGGAFPWRGRITCDPAPDQPGTVNNTAVAGAQINSFFDEYDNMIEHYVDLCAAAGGVDGFVIGTELPGITKVRSALGVYPAVPRLQSLAAYAKNNLPTSKVGYAADWSEWYDNAADGFWFHLDPLWADSNIDFCGIDNYLPMSDWRDGTNHLDYDAVNGPVSEFDPDYLADQIEGGEYYDYYYLNQADRDSQTRTPITDGGYSKPWVYRNKDLRNWWTNQHYNRPGGIEDASPTGWVPGSKPIWFTEFGVPAVNRGTNQPNVFYDPKSSESAFPYYSSGLRDDFIQRVGVETTLDYWHNNSPEINGLKMVEQQNMFIWTWDARPFPDWPIKRDIWSDGDLWFYGHWLNGRVEAVPLARLVTEICLNSGLELGQIDVSGLYGPGALVRGYLIDRPETSRASLETLSQAYLFDGFESEGKVKFLLRSNTRNSNISSDKYVVNQENPTGVSVVRGQETDLPTRVKVSFIDEFNNYNAATVDGVTHRGSSQNVEELSVPINLNEDYARSLADGFVQQKWVERHRGNLSLPPSLLAVDPGDALTFSIGENNITGRITTITTGELREVEFQAFEGGTFNLPAVPTQERLPAISDIFGSASIIMMDIPVFTELEPLHHAPRLAAHSEPWPGGVSLYNQLSDSTYKFNLEHSYRNVIGQLNAPLSAGPTGVWDRVNQIDVTFEYGALSSTDELSTLNGSIALAIYNENKSEWEIIQFATATLTGTRTYIVTDLLRGQLGSEHVMETYPIGSTVVLLEPSFISVVNVSKEKAIQEQGYSWGPSRYVQTDDTYQSGSFTGKRVGLRPYSPVGVEITKEPNNDLTINWKRRTRYNGDDWSVDEIPLNEDVEQYRLRIYNGGNVAFEQITSSPSYTYTSAQQNIDFGSDQTDLTLDIAQYGSGFGGYGAFNKRNYSISKARA